DELVATLVERVTERRVTALVGPRRYGKTSVLRRVVAEMAAAGTSVVWLDLYEVTSVADLARRFDRGLAEAGGPVRSRVDDLAVGVQLNLGLLGVELSRRGRDRPDPEAMFSLLVDVLVDGAAATPTVVVIDEFPGIDRVEGAAGLLRTKLQHRFQDIGLLFAGSQPSLMRAMFADRARPFYAQADLVEIGPFDLAATRAIVEDGFAATDRDPADLAGLLYAFTGGHPYRTMQVADVAWRLAVPGEPTDTTSLWARTLEAVRAESNLATETAFGHRSGSEKAVLRLIAHGDPLFGTAAELLGLTASSAQNARDALLADGDLVSRDRLEVVDPVVADWIRRRFPR
ncbi:MAG: AAA family ATPase, partial [Acidimicrobiia bacterium]